MTINDVTKHKLEEVRGQMSCSDSITVSENLDDYVSQELAQEFVHADETVRNGAVPHRRQGNAPKPILEIQGPQENQCTKPYLMNSISFKDSLKDKESIIKANTEESKAQNVPWRAAGCLNQHGRENMRPIDQDVCVITPKKTGGK